MSACYGDCKWCRCSPYWSNSSWNLVETVRLATPRGAYAGRPGRRNLWGQKRVWMEICSDTLALMCEASVGTGLSGRRQRWLLIGLVLIMGPKALPRLFVMMRALAGRGHVFFFFIWKMYDPPQGEKKMRNVQPLSHTGCDNSDFFLRVNGPDHSFLYKRWQMCTRRSCLDIFFLLSFKQTIDLEPSPVSYQLFTGQAFSLCSPK